MKLTYFFLSVAVLCGQTIPDIDGDWVSVVKRYDVTNYRRVTLHRNGGQITGAGGNLKITGTIRGNQVELHVKGDGGPGADWTGVFENGQVTGTGKSQDEQGQWSLVRPKTRPADAPRLHEFEPKVFYRMFSGSIAPVLHIYPGDTVRTWSVDAGGWDARKARRSLGGNPQTGPFYVEGALPGDTLVVKLSRVRLNRDSAMSGGGIAGSALSPYYFRNQKMPEKYDSSWTLDREKGVARLAHPTEAMKQYTVPLRPMLGCIGVAPPGDMAFRSGFLGPFGGNMDYNQMREGVTLYLPVFQPGALLFLGDGHAAQGDGELTGDALETSMDIEFTVDLIPDKAPGGPRVENGEYLMAMGIGGSLNEALQESTTEMARWLSKDYGLNPSEVASLLGTAMRYDIAEVVDPYVNVVAKVSKQALAPLRKAR